MLRDAPAPSGGGDDNSSHRRSDSYGIEDPRHGSKLVEKSGGFNLFMTNDRVF